MLEISRYNSKSSVYGLYKKIVSSIEFSANFEQSQRENLFIKDICKRVEKSKTVLYTLEIDNDIVGLIALSATSIDDQPSLQIDYIFVNELYRGLNMPKLDNLKPFRYLIELSINVAQEIKTSIGIRYIVLSPDTDELKHKYTKVAFQSLNDDWMYLKI